MSEHSHRVRLPVLAGQILLQPILFLQTGIECLEQQRIVLLPLLYFPGKRKLQPIQHLPERCVRIGEFARDEVSPFRTFFVRFQSTLKVRQELRETIGAEIRCLCE